jgi:UPF0755 protein
MVKKKSSFFKKILISLLLIIVIGGAIGGYWAYDRIFRSNVDLGSRKSVVIYIPTGSSFEDVVRILTEENLLRNRSAFEWLSQRKKYRENVKPGKYRILARMSNNELVNLLRAGIQEPVTINFNGLHTVDELMLRVGRRIEADSNDLRKAVRDDEFLSQYGFDHQSVQALFIPDSYEFFWNTSLEQFFDRMAKEYKAYWTEERKRKASALGLSQTEVAVLASIVQAEQCCDNEEKRIIAGLYLNRLDLNMALESDPTVIFALGDFSIQRVYNSHKQVDSPYNTFKNKGLPPGPIGFVRKNSLDAVLDREKNDYIFMCAKDDLSGKHYFSRTYEQHQVYAARYHAALNKRGIRK